MAWDANVYLGGVIPRRIDCHHRVTIQRNPSNEEIREMIDWCKNPELPGSFQHFFRSKVMNFHFSDQNVAFQFKMQWG